MKTILYVLIVMMCLVSRALGGPPAVIAHDVNEVRLLFDGKASGAYKVELMILAHDVYVDPPAVAPNVFRDIATVVVTIRSTYCHDLIQRVLDGIEKAPWKRVSSLGHPRAKWCIIGPGGKRFIDVLLESDQALIYVDNAWYKVDADLAESMTTMFIQRAARSLGDRE